MTSGANGEWVRQGTPRDNSAGWNEEQSEYGTAISPTEWDDYSSEQSVPVAPPRPQPGQPAGGYPTAGTPDSPAEREYEPVPGQEPDADEEYRSDESDPRSDDEIAGDTEDDGIEPRRVDEPDESGVADVGDGHDLPGNDEFLADEHDDEMTRPRPVVTGSSAVTGNLVDPVGVQDDQEDVGHADTAVADVAEEPLADRATEASAGESLADDEGVGEAAEYLAVDPEPVDVVGAEPTNRDEDIAPVAEDVDPAPVAYDADQASVTEDVDPAPVAYDADPVSVTEDVDPASVTEDVDPAPVAYDTDPTPVTENVDDEPTHHVDTDDMEATQAASFAAVPAATPAGGAASASTAPVPDGLYRAGGSEETAVIAPDAYPGQDVDVEEERLQAQLEAERQAREQRLGAVPTSSDNAIREDAGPPRVTTDRFFPSFGLFILRIVTASILGVASYQILGSGVDTTADFLGNYPLIPEPRLVAWILGFTLGAMALLLIIGMLQRVVGFLLLVIAVCSLVFIRWGNFAIFNAQVEGFIGDKDLLLAAVGLLFLAIGGGAWGIDGAFRRARAASKAERQG